MVAESPWELEFRGQRRDLCEASDVGLFWQNVIFQNGRDDGLDDLVASLLVLALVVFSIALQCVKVAQGRGEVIGLVTISVVFKLGSSAMFKRPVRRGKKCESEDDVQEN